MVSHTTDRTPGRLLFLMTALLVSAVLFLSGSNARAQEAKKTGTSLDIIPADAAFFSNMLRNREQIDIFYKSNAYRTLRSLPLVKMAYEKAKAELAKDKNSPFEAYKKFTAEPQNKELIEVLVQAVSDDLFVYGGKGWGDLFRLFGKINNAQQWAPLQALASGQDPQKAQLRAVLLAAQKNRELLVVPDLVFGFKVKDAKKAVAQLDRLEKHASALVERVPPLKGKLNRSKIGGGDFLVLNLDGTTIPWDDANLREFEENKDEFADLVKHLKKITLSVSIGVKDGYLMLGVTSTGKNLAKLGSEGKSLATLPEFAPLMKHVEKPLVGIGYVSKQFYAGMVANAEESIVQMTTQAKSLLEKADVIKEDRKKAIIKDLDKYSAEWKKSIVAPGAQMSFAFMTDTGMEGYNYNFSKTDAFNGVKCNLLNHLGGDPIFAAAVGFKVDGSSYKALSTFIQTIYGHAEAIALDLIPDPDAKDLYKKGAKNILPVFKRLDDVITKQLLPSMKEGGLGLVLDAKWTSKQWVKELPALPKAMPMAELGLLLGVSDPKMFTTALKDFRLTLNDLIAKTRESVPNSENIPEFKIPAPEIEKGKNGTLIFYPLPRDIGLDKQFFPVAGVGGKVGVLALSKAFAERLMANTPLKIKGTPLDRSGNIIGGCVLNWPGLVDAVDPWIEFGLRTALAQAKGPKEGMPKPEEVLKQVKVTLEVLKCFKGSTTATYIEDGKFVTHTQIVVKDLPKKE